MKTPNINLKDPKNQTLILAILIAILVVILYFTLLLRPQVARVAGAVIKNSKIKAELKSVEEDVSNIPKYTKEIDAYKDKIERYERILPAEQEVPSLLESLSAMAKTSGVKIVGITPVSVPEDKRREGQVYLETPILISAKSGYHEIAAFLSKLEDADRFMKVVDIEIKVNRNSPKKHDVELLVLTYVLLKGK